MKVFEELNRLMSSIDKQNQRAAVDEFWKVELIVGEVEAGDGWRGREA